MSASASWASGASCSGTSGSAASRPPSTAASAPATTFSPPAALAALEGTRRERDGFVDVEREHRDIHRVGEQAGRAFGVDRFDRVGRLDEDLRALLGPARYVSS